MGWKAGRNVALALIGGCSIAIAAVLCRLANGPINAVMARLWR